MSPRSHPVVHLLRGPANRRSSGTSPAMPRGPGSSHYSTNNSGSSSKSTHTECKPMVDRLPDDQQLAANVPHRAAQPFSPAFIVKEPQMPFRQDCRKVNVGSISFLVGLR